MSGEIRIVEGTGTGGVGVGGVTGGVGAGGVTGGFDPVELSLPQVVEASNTPNSSTCHTKRAI